MIIKSIALILGQAYSRELTLQKIQSPFTSKSRPRVEGLPFTWGCSSNINKLQEGPADWFSIINSGEKFTDPDFNGLETIFWFNGSNWQYYIDALLEYFFYGGSFKRLGDEYPSSTLFGSNAGFDTPI